MKLKWSSKGPKNWLVRDWQPTVTRTKCVFPSRLVAGFCWLLLGEICSKECGAPNMIFRWLWLLADWHGHLLFAPKTLTCLKSTSMKLEKVWWRPETESNAITVKDVHCCINQCISKGTLCFEGIWSLFPIYIALFSFTTTWPTVC